MFMSENIQAALLSLPMELQRLTTELKAGLQETHAGQRIDAARYVDVGRAPLLWGDRCRLVGWSLREAGDLPDSPASITLRNGRDDTAEVVAVIDLAAGGHETRWLGPGGVAVTEALWATVEGTVEGTVYLGVVD